MCNTAQYKKFRLETCCFSPYNGKNKSSYKIINAERNNIKNFQSNWCLITKTSQHHSCQPAQAQIDYFSQELSGEFVFRSYPSIPLYFSWVSTNIYSIIHMIGFTSQHSWKWLAQGDINCRSKP